MGAAPAKGDWQAELPCSADSRPAVTTQPGVQSVRRAPRIAVILSKRSAAGNLDPPYNGRASCCSGGAGGARFFASLRMACCAHHGCHEDYPETPWA